jgi:CheY-like chemotaxis protein
MHKTSYKAVDVYSNGVRMINQKFGNEHSKKIIIQNTVGQDTKKIDTAIIKPHILLVEDDYIAQFAHKHFLESIGCNVFVAADGYQALALFKDKPDLILLDIGLPKMSGLDVCRAIRQQESDSHVPIIALTAFEKDIALDCTEAGINDFATKPINRIELKKILERWLPNIIFPDNNS